MPVDRDLAYESLKWVDPKVYRIYCKLRYGGMAPREFNGDSESFRKLYLTEKLNDALDMLEAKGRIEVLNDYDNEQILFKKNRHGALDV